MNEKTALLTTTTTTTKDKTTTKDNGGATTTTTTPTNNNKSPTSRMSAIQRRLYPAPFFDPITKKLMQDPVVAPGGISYERSSWETILENKKKLRKPASAPAYPNRALKQLIEEAILASKDFRQNNFRRSSQLLSKKVQLTVRRSLTEIREKSILPSDDRKPMSEAYYCPITMSLMQRPVIGPEGYSFEKDAIEHWIDKNQVSPLTRTPLPSKQLLYPNMALRDMLQLEAAKISEDDDNGEDTVVNQSIRDFKSSLLQQQQQQQQQQQEEKKDDNHNNKNNKSDSNTTSQPPKQQLPMSSSYTGPNTLEEWEALRQQRRKSNVELSLNGLLQFLYFVLLLIVGVVVGIVLGALALVFATLLDLLVAPCIQCLFPGGCYYFHGGGGGGGGEDSDPFGDDEVPFIVLELPPEQEEQENAEEQEEHNAEKKVGE